MAGLGWKGAAPRGCCSGRAAGLSGGGGAGEVPSGGLRSREGALGGGAEAVTIGFVGAGSTQGPRVQGMCFRKSPAVFFSGLKAAVL